jgi:uncharacterized repeat protein (TIGR02543 family)
MGDGQFYFGNSGGTAGNITMEGFTFDGYTLGQVGIIWVGNAHDLTLNNMVVRNSRCNGTTAQPYHSWALYLSYDAGIHPSNITADNWTVDGSVRQMSAFTMNGGSHASATGWFVSSAYYAVYASGNWGPLTEFVLDDWRVRDSGATTWEGKYVSVYFEDASGQFSNMHATNSGVLLNMGMPQMTDGGSNSIDTLPPYTLTTNPSPSGGGSIGKSPNAVSYASGAVVTLLATPSPGFAFIGWSGDLTGAVNPTTIAMDKNKMVTATFTEVPISSLITHYYLSLLDRSPDEPGYVFWANEINRVRSLGTDVQEGFIALARLFLTRAEYLAKNTTPEAYIADLYTTFFNRIPDPVTEVKYWTDLMAAGMSRDITMNWFVYDPAYASYVTGVLGMSITRPENNLVNDLYRGFLNRLPDTTGFNAQLSVMRAAQASGAAAVRSTTLAIALNFAGGPEYALRARTNTQFIEDCYNGILRRGALAPEIQSWVTLLNNDASRSEVLTGFVSSPEFQARVNQVIAAGPYFP